MPGFLQVEERVMEWLHGKAWLELGHLDWLEELEFTFSGSPLDGTQLCHIYVFQVWRIMVTCFKYSISSPNCKSNPFNSLPDTHDTCRCKQCLWTCAPYVSNSYHRLMLSGNSIWHRRIQYILLGFGLDYYRYWTNSKWKSHCKLLCQVLQCSAVQGRSPVNWMQTTKKKKVNSRLKWSGFSSMVPIIPLANNVLQQLSEFYATPGNGAHIPTLPVPVHTATHLDNFSLEFCRIHWFSVDKNAYTPTSNLLLHAHDPWSTQCKIPVIGKNVLLPGYPKKKVLTIKVIQ